MSERHPPELQILLASLVALALLVLFCGGSLSLWGRAATRLFERRPILPQRPHRAAPWGFIDLVFTVVAVFALQAGAGELLRRSGIIVVGGELSVDDYFLALVASAVCSVLAFVLSYVWVTQRTKATPEEIGFRFQQIGRDMVLGCAAFVMLAPLVFGIQMVFVLILGPTQHPFILLLQKSPDLRLFAAASINAVLIAPVVEEYFFRSLWQGWTESLRWPLRGEEALLGRNSTPESETHAGEKLDLASTDAAGEQHNPYVAPPELREPLLAEVADTVDNPPARWWPIVVSSVLFAIAHVKHGPDGIALFVLALGLGYIFQRTRSLTPCIVVHFLLNGTSMLLLWVQLFAKGAAS